MNLDLSLTDTKSKWEIMEKYAIDTGLIVDDVKRVFEFARRAHEGQKRMSGEPFFNHPFWVAKVITQLGIGHKAVFAALLHDSVEDTNLTIDDIAAEFGEETALIVMGLTEVKNKTRGIEVHSESIEVFRRFLLSSVNDVRILIVRIVDKLHNGLTIQYLPYERQIRYAQMVLGIYVPVAEYVGLHFFKKRLEDIAFRILEPEKFEKVEEIIKNQKRNEEDALADIETNINNMLAINRINDCQVNGRIKGIYSSYQKIVKKGDEAIADRVGLRIICNTVEECYWILGLIHAAFTYLPDEFDDYISNPKPNGYRSIQTTVLWNNKLKAEVQIRTKEMHEFNEFGPASHIVYKFNKGTYDSPSMEWVRNLVRWQDEADGIKKYQIDVLKDYVYVFTPKGDTVQLPFGSTALDFAYRIHTEVGDYCRGVKINKKIAKLGQKLKTGDMVEVLVARKKQVNKNWLDIVVTDWARNHIKKIFAATLV